MDDYTGGYVLTKNSVDLDKPEDWANWLQLRRSSANQHNLWEYINPSTKEENLKKLSDKAAVIEQSLPRLANYLVPSKATDAAAGAKVPAEKIMGLDGLQFRRYRYQMSIYEGW
ncbi:hypothetical protein P154DRAFT_615013 [Amniculicola lignicola CBS 123094]|uniref:Uncharacterized protein n=1 Tax=Amniculicola lignicola CBS 123094 TaxID=1392246 RepID=A0A6A5X2X9_9PLEO|nr:hypothetical protein P154DRAFT_615013 [Amniculicola lignicola CBS 123094]